MWVFYQPITRFNNETSYQQLILAITTQFFFCSLQTREHTTLFSFFFFFFFSPKDKHSWNSKCQNVYEPKRYHTSLHLYKYVLDSSFTLIVIICWTCRGPFPPSLLHCGQTSALPLLPSCRKLKRMQRQIHTCSATSPHTVHTHMLSWHLADQCRAEGWTSHYWTQSLWSRSTGEGVSSSLSTQPEAG